MKSGSRQSEAKQSWSKSGEPAETLAKLGVTARKALMCVWWNWRGIIYYELLPYGTTVNAEMYCQQLDSLKEAIAQKRPIEKLQTAFRIDDVVMLHISCDQARLYSNQSSIFYAEE